MENKDGRDKMILPFTQVPNILVRERYLSSNEKLLLFYIASMGPLGLTMSTKALRLALAPLGNTGLLRAIKRLQFLGMIKIEQVPKQKGDPIYKKPCHRYYFIKDPLVWRHTIDFRRKLKTEMERLENHPKLNFKTEVYLDDKALADAFEVWLNSRSPVAFHEKPQAAAVEPSPEAMKWISKIEKLKNGEFTFLKIADDAINFSYFLEDLSEEEKKKVCREKVKYIDLIFQVYLKEKENPSDEQIAKDLEWVESLQRQGKASEQISSEIFKENKRRLSARQ